MIWTAINKDQIGRRFPSPYDPDGEVIVLYCAQAVVAGRPYLYQHGFPTSGQEHKAVTVAAGVGIVVIAAESQDSGEKAVFYIKGKTPDAYVRYGVTTGHFLKALAAEPTMLVEEGAARTINSAAQAKTTTQTVMTSGTLTVGYEYKILDWITDDDFANVGGTNADGSVFTATGTTPTTWTNSSTVVRTADDAGDATQEVLLTGEVVTVS